MLTTGKGKAKKDLGPDDAISAQDRFAKLTPRERAAIIAYVKARADRPPAGAIGYQTFTRFSGAR